MAFSIRFVSDPNHRVRFPRLQSCCNSWSLVKGSSPKVLARHVALITYINAPTRHPSLHTSTFARKFPTMSWSPLMHCFSLLVVSSLTFLSFMSSAQAICNGHAELCNRKYSNVTQIGAHDSAFVGMYLSRSSSHDLVVYRATGYHFNISLCFQGISWYL